MKAYFLIIALFTASLLPSCNQGNVDLDNASDEALVAIIDNVPYQLAPRSYKRIELGKGSHSLKIQGEGGKIIADTVVRIIEGGLLNVGRAEYYIWTDLYGDPTLKESKLEEEWVNIGKQQFYGEFSQLEKNLYVEKRWDFDLNQSFPDDLLGWKLASQKYLIKSKLFRKEQLISAYNSLVKTNKTKAAKVGT